jgi:hypothetical protein
MFFEVIIMETKTNGNKPHVKRPKEKKKYSEEEMNLIKATKSVLNLIEKQKKRGIWKEFEKEEVAV